MGDWKKTKINQFLFEREGKYQPDDKAVSELKRINKIDFSGNFHIVAKPSNTHMILIRPGDLVISGINVSKGAMGIYNGKEDVTATIHYSSYTFDTEKINVGYFKRFLKSPEFGRLLLEQVKGGIKTEIKPKHILPLEVALPDIEEQEKIVSHFKSVETEDEELKQEFTHQQALLKKLRQQILQEAIEGKLTANWREKNPDVEPASELLKRIQAEKAQLIKDKKIKKQKPLPPIDRKEKPFDLPEGWEWCRLGEIFLMHYGKGLAKSQTKNSDKYAVYGSNGVVGYYSKRLTDKRAIIIGRKGSAGAIQISNQGSWTTDVAYYIEESSLLNFDYLIYLLTSLRLDRLGKGVKPGLNRSEVYSLVIPLVPLKEQKAIVTKVEKLLALCAQLETQITANQAHAEQLMQAVLKETFQQNNSKPATHATGD